MRLQVFFEVHMKYPKMRPVSAFPVTHAGREMICLKDDSGFSESAILVPKQVFFIASMLTGENGIRDIQSAYMRTFGDMLFSDRIQTVIDELDKNLFLEGERFETHRKKLIAEFKEAPTRPYRHQEGTRDLEPTRLRSQLASYFSHPDGPGERRAEASPARIKGIMLPHIDYLRGGPCYAWGYSSLEILDDVDTFFILGVNHMAREPLFSVTPKPFETPLGLMETDRDFVKALIKNCGQDLLEGEFYHRNEHSIELQTIWLKYLYADKLNVKIVPVLCAGFDHFITQGVSPINDARVSDFVNSVRQTIATGDRKVCFMASVDLSHIGPQFGHKRPVSPGDLADIRSADLETLRSVEALDRESFWQNVAGNANHQNICGLPAIYTLLSTMDASEGKLLRYSQWRDEKGWGCVTFASVVFYA